MNWLKRIWKKIFATKKPDIIVANPPVVVVLPSPPIPEIPTMEEVESFPSNLELEIDNINNGSPKNPDWSYLAYTCKIDEDKKAAVFQVVNEQAANWKRYKYVSGKTGVPAGVIADIHQKECSLDFKACLHNGDYAIGNGKKTKNVPAGRGPFSTWEEAAIDALTMDESKYPTSSNWKKYYSSPGWTTVNILKFHQMYNGMGHQNKGLEYTPYIWAYTNHHDETGNYVSDGKYSSTAKIKSPGTMALMLARNELGFSS